MRLLMIGWLVGLCLPAAHAATVSGTVTDSTGQPLAFASVVVKGSSQGTSANSLGFYSIQLPAGQYTLVARHVGYAAVERQVTLQQAAVRLDFMLAAQQYTLHNVVVRSNEDPAYAIIKNTIAKRAFHEQENNRFTVDVYIKGRLQLRDFPRRVLGQKVDFEDGDTSKRKVIFLSETEARYAADGNKRKVEVISTRVSGQSDGFGFSNPQIFSFYQNNIKLGSLNPRGFVSPIADNALSFYRYTFEGSFFEDGRMIDRVRVIPLRTYEPLFNGYINIIDNEWRIHSLQMVLYKENQMQMADTLVVEQQYVPLQHTWVVKQQTILPSVKFLGFDGYGSFVQVYDDYNLDPVFSKGFFDNTVLKFHDSANKKTKAYWDSIRPVPLIEVEVKDYRKKDSLEALRSNPAYLDSIDRVRNRPNIAGLITTGQTFYNQKKRETFTVNSALSAVNFNTVEGLVADLHPTYTRRWSEGRRNRIHVTPQLRYGFGNGHFNPSIDVQYVYGRKYYSSVSIGGGRRVLQIDNRNPVLAYRNTIATLYWESNFIKIYEAATFKAAYTKGVGEGLQLTAAFEYQQRSPLANTTLYTWRDIKTKAYTPNIGFAPHKASIATLRMRWQPGARYIEYPDRKVMLRSKFPVFNIEYAGGLPGLLGSDVDYSRWKLGMSQNINLALAGQLSYNLVTGGFLSDRKTYLPDNTHYLANQFLTQAPYLQSFQLMRYYQYSNTARVFFEQHTEYHLNGLLTNKIPGFKKLNWFLVTGNNLLYINGGTLYGEVFVGLENVLKMGRIDVIQSFTGKGWMLTGVRYSFGNLLQ